MDGSKDLYRYFIQKSKSVNFKVSKTWGGPRTNFARCAIAKYCNATLCLVLFMSVLLLPKRTLFIGISPRGKILGSIPLALRGPTSAHGIAPPRRTETVSASKSIVRLSIPILLKICLKPLAELKIIKGSCLNQFVDFNMSLDSIFVKSIL